MAFNSVFDKDHPHSTQHCRTSSSDQSKSQLSTSSSMTNDSIEHEAIPKSPSKPRDADKQKSKRRKNSSASTTSKHRPTYSRKYSTPPSRPLSPSGYPQLLDSDMTIPELYLEQANHHLLQVDSAPQDPDLWEDPETDYFSTIEGGPISRHRRGESRRQVSQNLNAMMQQAGVRNTNGNALKQINEDAEAEFHLPPTPGAWGG